MLFAVLFAMSLARNARADVKQCIEDHKSAQEDDKAGRLISARERFQRCAAAECPEMIRDECKLLHTQTQNRIPSVVVTASLTPGTTATVSVDGKPPVPVTATAIELDPGSHTFAVQSSDGRTHSETVTLTAGMKNHALRIELGGQPLPTPGPPVPQPPQPPHPHIPPRSSDGPSYTGPIVMAIVGGGALVLFGLLAGAGFIKQNELDDCKPNCKKEDVDMMRTRYLGADIMLGVAGASLATALIWWLVVRGEEPATQVGGVKLTPGGVSISF